MNQELPSNKDKNEEVDLIVFFNLIGNAISKVFAFIASIFKFIFSFIILILKIIIDGWKIILGVVLIAAIIGYFSERKKPDVYFSEMLVEPYFDSKYQLISNINYFDGLVKAKDYETLNEIFNTNSDPDLSVEDIKGFKVETGPETENEKIISYQAFTKNLDSASRETITYKEYLENRSIYSGNRYLIIAYSDKRDIFKKLEKGVLSALTNQFSNEEFEKQKQLREVKKLNLLAQLNVIDSLKAFYIKIRTNESQSNSKQIKLGDISLSNEDKSTTKEFELLEKENEIRNTLSDLEEEKIEKNKLYDVISGFQGAGNKSTSIFYKYSILFPLLSFILLCLFIIARKIILFAKKYEN